MVAHSSFSHNSQLQELIARGRQQTAELEARRAAEDAERRATWKAEIDGDLDELIAAGALPEWMREYCSVPHGERWAMTIMLPGCSPIIADYTWGTEASGTKRSWRRLHVVEATDLEYSTTLNNWYTRTRLSEGPADSDATLEQIVAIAADLGESYWEMRREADRRNAAGIVYKAESKPRITLPGLYTRALDAAVDADYDSDGAISATLAVAAEIRALRNVIALANGLEEVQRDDAN